MLLTLIEIRNRMLNCKPGATVSITMNDDDVVLHWNFLDYSGAEVVYLVEVDIDGIRANCRVFERQMHKAKRAMKRM